MDGFPEPLAYVDQVRRLHLGARYSIMFYEQDLLVGSNEAAHVEDMRYDGFEAHGSELTLLFSEHKTHTEG